MKRETPGEAPAVRNTWFGLAGYPSRSDSPSQFFWPLRRGSRGFCFRTLNEIRDGSPDERDTLGVGVRADGTDLSKQLLSTLNHVCGERIFRGVDQFRVFGQRRDLQRRTP